MGPLIPVSTYGASKLAGEALLGSYCHMFGLTGRAFRFANVVGPRQTHGVGFDFRAPCSAIDPSRLRILGDGTQSKSYIHVYDVIDAVLLASAKAPGLLTRSTTSPPATTSPSARSPTSPPRSHVGLTRPSDDYRTGGDRGWKGDVPIVRINTDRIRALGWANRWSSAEALRASAPWP